MAVETIQSTEIPSVPQSLEDLAIWAQDFSRDHFDDLKKLDTILSLVSGGFIEIPAAPTVPGADGNWRWYHDGTDLILQLKISDVWTDTAVKFLTTGEVKSLAGRIKKTSRYTTTQAIPTTDDQVYCNGTFTVTLPVGEYGQSFRIINSGTGTITVAPNGAELLTGENASRTLSGSSVIILTYETTEGWW